MGVSSSKNGGYPKKDGLFHGKSHRSKWMISTGYPHGLGSSPHRISGVNWVVTPPYFRKPPMGSHGVPMGSHGVPMGFPSPRPHPPPWSSSSASPDSWNRPVVCHGAWRYGNLTTSRYRGFTSLCHIISYPIGSMYAIYGNIYHQYTPNVSIYTIHGSYGYMYIHMYMIGNG